MLISSNEILRSGIQFGTSGARGLVTQFTANACAAFTHAFIRCMEKQFKFKHVAIAIDNRPSSPAMAQACIKALEQLGIEAIYYGVIPTPALAYTSMEDVMPCIMVTGSHIPFNRNGLKFYRPDGEISKSDEQDILNINAEFEQFSELSQLVINPKAAIAYVKRYASLFDSNLLKGKRVGIYEHSSAGRELYAKIFTTLGAEVFSLERSDEFVPIDTEAVSEVDKLKAKTWSLQYDLDFIFSTDGDGDRPLVADENGDWLRGDTLGLLCSKFLNIEALVVPVSCNTMIETIDFFKHVERTKIGSPYVIAEFSRLNNIYNYVAGFEANGGYLLGSDIIINNKKLKALPTRDAVLPALILLAAGGQEGISHLVKALPKRVTHSDRIKDFPAASSSKVLQLARDNPKKFLKDINILNIDYKEFNMIDGFRIILNNNDVIHLRPSGNAPELRCYAESNTVKQAVYLVNHTLKEIRVLMSN